MCYSTNRLCCCCKSVNQIEWSMKVKYFWIFCVNNLASFSFTLLKFCFRVFVKTGFSWLIIWSHLRKKGNIFVIIIIISIDALCLLAEKKELHQWKKSHIGNERKKLKSHILTYRCQLLTVKILIIIATLSSPTIQICWLHVFLKMSCTTFCMLHEISKCCMILQSRYCKLAIIKLLLSKFGKCSHHEFVDAVFWGNLITW